MKKRLLLAVLMVLMLICAFALAVNADVYRTERTYNYYENEIADENLLFTAKTIYAYDNKSYAQTYRFEVITSSSGVGFAKYDADGNPLTWYVVSDSHIAGSDYSDSENYVRNIVVASAKTTDVGSIDASGKYTYNDGYDSKKIVSANFFGLEIKSFPDAFYMATASKAPNGNSKEYCKIADGSYLLALYLPETLTSIPKNLCTRTPIITLEFENNKVSYTNFGAQESNMYPFAFCANLKSLVIPEGITEVRKEDFREAISLEYLEYANTVLKSHNNAFFRSGYPETVVYGENMTFIGYLDSEPYRFYVDTKEAGMILKYLYVPNTITASGSKFASYRGGISGGDTVSTAKNRLVFFFAGTLDEARAIGALSTEDQFIMTYDATKAASKGYTYYDPISYETYLANKDYYNNELTGNLLVYNVPKCIAFYNGQHAMEDGIIFTDYLSEFKVGEECQRCGMGEYVVCDPVFTPLGYSLQIGGDKICLGYTVNETSLAYFPDIKYGAVVVVPDENATNLEPINPDGSLAAERAAYYIVDKKYCAFEFIVKSFSKDNAYYSLPIVMCAFVSDGEKVDYLCSDEDGNILQQEYATVTSFNEIYESTKHKVTFSVADDTMGTLEGETTQKVADGLNSTTVTAVPNEGYDFACWSNGETSPSITVSPTKNTDLVAYFTPASTGLPVMTINTDEGVDITTKEYYINCEITLYDTETGKSIGGQLAEIKGRGNSTWERFDKKPYKFKFDEKQDLFGYGNEKTWVLLADARDYSLVRNMLAYNTALSMSELGYTSKGQSVELYLNGEYRGVYYLCEQIQVKENRVNITEEDSDTVQNPEDLGYLIEMDAWAADSSNKYLDNYTLDGDVFVTITGGQYPFVIKDPEDVFLDADGNFDATKAEPYLIYIKNYLQACHDAMYAEKTEENYAKVCELIDVKSFAQAYIIFELFKNPDTNYSSVYYYKDADGKLVCSPVWDFDMSVGNVTHKEGNTGWQIFSDTTRLWTRERNYWYNQLLQFPQFEELVGQELKENETTIRTTIAKNLEYAIAHKAAYEKNFTKWNLIGNSEATENMGNWSVPSEFIAFTSWKAHIDYIKNYLNESLAYLIEAYPAPSTIE